MEKSTIYLVSLNILNNNFYIYPTLIDENDCLTEWYEKPNHLILLSSLDENKLKFNIEHINYNEFNIKFKKTIPLISNKGFLDYLSQVMNKCKDDGFSCVIRKGKINEDLEKFWGKPVSSFLLKQQLDSNLLMQKEILLSKI